MAPAIKVQTYLRGKSIMTGHRARMVLHARITCRCHSHRARETLTCATDRSVEREKKDVQMESGCSCTCWKWGLFFTGQLVRK
ncbi:hypothetical protein SKAU_G00237660 [Synaphobranchus kaupii]|uniref:Uncharacterized protein n=1 Tax=Synaphobranchus kaupii TaxID=118154 RepID=A0A9Q1F738_SYNKA|nr:hypothetical protein SKAU_G00237660 [Synaphobranchus kaupii]